MPTTPDMNLVLPTVSVTAGPLWATELNAALTLVDAHDHTTGKGVPIVPSAININADLTFNSYNATTLRTTRFDSQSVALAIGTDINCLYSVVGAPTWNDASSSATRLVNVAFPMVIGDLVYASSTTVFGKLGIGATGQILKVVAGLPSWQAATSTVSVVSKTFSDSPYTISATDDVILWDDSSGSSTANLPLATGTGKTYTLKKTNLSFATKLTIARAGSNTITDLNAGLTSTTLNTLGEELDIVDASTGVWQVLRRRIPGPWNTITVVPNATAFGTISTLVTRARRVGGSIEIIGSFVLGTVGAATSRIVLPTGLVVDTSVMTTTKRAACGSCWFADDGTTGVYGTNNRFGVCLVDNSTTDSFYLSNNYVSGDLGTPNANASGALVNVDTATFHVTLPIVGWNE